MAKSDKQKGAYVRYMCTDLGKIASIPISPVTTRWNSFSDAIDRYVEIHQDISRYAASDVAIAVGADVIRGNVLSDREVR